MYYSKEDVERLKRIKQLKTIHRLNSAAIRRELESTGSPPLPQEGREDDQPAASGVGRRLRLLRTRHRMTIRELARTTGLSPSFLSALERGETGASIASLSSIVQVYGMNMRDVFDADLKKSSLLVRPEDRPTMQWSNGVRYEELATSGSLMNPSFVYVPPHSGSGGCYFARWGRVRVRPLGLFLRGARGAGNIPPRSQGCPLLPLYNTPSVVDGARRSRSHLRQ